MPSAGQARPLSGFSAQTPKAWPTRREGHTTTLKTSGPEGAYLIVTRCPPGASSTKVSAPGASYLSAVRIREIHYRDGAVCHLTSKSWIGGAFACTPSLQVPVGYVAPGDSHTPIQKSRPPSPCVASARAEATSYISPSAHVSH